MLTRRDFLQVSAALLVIPAIVALALLEIVFVVVALVMLLLEV